MSTEITFDASAARATIAFIASALATIAILPHNEQSAFCQNYLSKKATEQQGYYTFLADLVRSVFVKHVVAFSYFCPHI